MLEKNNERKTVMDREREKSWQDKQNPTSSRGTGCVIVLLKFFLKVSLPHLFCFFSLSLSKTKTTVGAIAAIAPCNRHFFIDGRVNCRIEKYFWWGERERKQKLLDDANRANKLTPTNKKETKRKKHISTVEFINNSACCCVSYTHVIGENLCSTCELHVLMWTRYRRDSVWLISHSFGTNPLNIVNCLLVPSNQPQFLKFNLNLI
jgi:hypothetical protein